MTTDPKKYNPYYVVTWSKLSLVATFGSFLTSIIGDTIFGHITKGSDSFGKYIKITVDYQKLQNKTSELIQGDPEPTLEAPKPLSGGCNCQSGGEYCVLHGGSSMNDTKEVLNNTPLMNDKKEVTHDKADYSLMIYQKEWEKNRIFRIIYESEKTINNIKESKICGNKFMLTVDKKAAKLPKEDELHGVNPLTPCDQFRDKFMQAISKAFILALTAIVKIGSIFDILIKKATSSKKGGAKLYPINYEDYSS